MSQVEHPYDPPTRPNSDGSVNYTVKELLARVDLKVDGLYEKLDNKVDQVEFVKVKAVVDDLVGFKARIYGAIAVLSALTAAGVFHNFFP